MTFGEKIRNLRQKCILSQEAFAKELGVSFSTVNRSLLVIITSGKSIKENWKDVLAVAFNTYFVAESTGKTIGIRH